jgi:hypothetical protein
MNNQHERETVHSEGAPYKIEFCDPAPLRLHPLHKFLPGPDVASDEWHAFVDAASATGPEGMSPIVITAEGLIMDGERRWKAALQLQWKGIGCVTRPEWEAAALMIESLVGQRCLSKGAKVYLLLAILPEYSKGVNTRCLAWGQKGVQILQKPFTSPFPYSVGERHGWKGSEDLAARLGVSKALVEQAVQIRKTFDLPALVEHKFTFQDGRQKTLKEYFEPLILDPVHPMGLGEVRKGISTFLLPDGTPREQAPPERNSHFFYWTRAWEGWAKQCGRWEGMSPEMRVQAEMVMAATARGVPAAVLKAAAKVFKAEQKRRAKQGKREEAKT